eukprot:TRINITY_DN3753_c0_g2_i1.p2 TRINITY_DN3753_c0_g2~~TRINITY_DN3753_c0_g2_i1.p2  ORF type:complete len:223 (+),score=61.61 TRINITY_DN3753_c0_g2_i1:118-786(+)
MRDQKANKALHVVEYGSRDYWEGRYKKLNDVCDKEKYFEWFQGYDTLKAVLERFMPTDDDSARSSREILNVGCGNSRLGEALCYGGHGVVTNIDFSPAVIEFMAGSSPVQRPDLRYVAMDATAMTWPENTFDVAIDKGTLDSMTCSDVADVIVPQMCREVARVLKSGGRYLVITYGAPSARLCYFEPLYDKWRLEEVVEVPGQSAVDNGPGNMEYMYVLQKR